LSADRTCKLHAGLRTGKDAELLSRWHEQNA